MANRASVVFDPALACPRELWLKRFAAPGTTQCFRGRGSAIRRTMRTHPAAKLERKAGSRWLRAQWPCCWPCRLSANMGPWIDAPDAAAAVALYHRLPNLLRWTLLIVDRCHCHGLGRARYLCERCARLRHGTTNMNTLVSLGTGVAFLYSAYRDDLRRQGRQVYFDAVLLILGFLLLGKSAGGARQTPRAWLRWIRFSRLRPANCAPHRGWCGSGGAAGRDSARRQRAGAAGRAHSRWMRRFSKGRTTVDESMLTGESTPLGRESRRTGAGGLAQLRRRGRVPAQVAGRRHGAGADCAHG